MFKKIKKSARKLVLLCLLPCLAAALFSCDRTEEPSIDTDTYRVFCTVFSTYDWLSEVTREVENIEVTLLDTHGADLHSYQPTAADMVTIANSDLAVYVGGSSDAWVAEAVKHAGTSVQGVSLFELLGARVKDEELVEGMSGEHEHEHDHAHEISDASEADEHVWLSLKNADLLTEALTERLCADNAEQADALRGASSAYRERLQALDAAYTDAVDGARLSVFLTADRFPFRYLADDYGLTYYAAFPGCSAETDAGFDTVIFLAETVDAYALTHIAVTESTDGAVARAVLENAKSDGVQTVVLDSLQSVTRARIEAGETYLSVMEKNLESLRLLLS